MVLTFVLQLHAAASGPFLPPGGDTLNLLGPVPADEGVAQDRDPRATPVLLAVLLGPFGAHRLHLGTSPKVVIIYGATLGGFGILPLIDLGHLLFAKDQQRFRNNDKLLMWR
ncbi:MAG: TM2 domain-containing protein [Flavobacteriales bacterium]|nr:TM2 domain-containing protein [Flavobacteriales bacterium]